MRSLSSSSSVSTTQVADGFRRLVRPLLPWASAAAIVISILQSQDSLSHSLVFGFLSGTTLISFLLWSDRGGSCIPLLPFFLFTNFLVYGLPFLFLSNYDFPDQYVDLVTLPLLLWQPMIILGWLLVPRNWFQRRPQRSLIDLGASQHYLPHLLLLLSLSLYLILSSPLTPDIIGDSSFTAIRSVLFSTLTILVLPAGFIGAYRWSRGQLRDPIVFWVIATIFFWAYILSLLLSSAQGLVLSILLGLWIGRSRHALLISISLLLLVSFLHVGKAVMREKYWSESAAKPSPPQLLYEWYQSSMYQLMLPSTDAAKSASLQVRTSNVGMLLYAQLQLQRGTPALMGQTYALIPQVLVPRILNPDKVRSQEGQVVLNLHFGRQLSRRDTEKTYIAWGLLPESVGNYGPSLGPCIAGLCVGILCRCIELVGFDQDLLSRPGLESLIAGILLIASYEMVSTTLAAALFQSLVIIELTTFWFVARRPG